MELHRETSESLEHTMHDQERENAMLKLRIAKIETALNPHSLLAKPISIV